MGNDQYSLPLRKGGAYLRPSFGTYETFLTRDIFFIAVHFELKLFDMALPGAANRVIACNVPELCELVMNSGRNVLPMTVHAVTEIFLARVWSELFPDTWWEDRLHEKKYQSLFHYIETHRSPASLTVNELAEFAGLRREVFSRNFTHALGMTPKEYLVRT